MEFLNKALIHQTSSSLDDAEGRRFDLVYIDDCHHSAAVFADAVASWPLVKLIGRRIKGLLSPSAIAFTFALVAGLVFLTTVHAQQAVSKPLPSAVAPCPP